MIRHSVGLHLGAAAKQVIINFSRRMHPSAALHYTVATRIKPAYCTLTMRVVTLPSLLTLTT